VNAELAVLVAAATCAAVGAGVAIFGVLHAVRGCPGSRALLRMHELEEGIAEWVSTSEAREHRVAEAANRMTRAAAQIDRKRRAKAAEAEEPDEQENGAPAQPQAPPAESFDQATLARFLAE
jgi:hypothetical protein